MKNLVILMEQSAIHWKTVGTAAVVEHLLETLTCAAVRVSKMVENVDFIRPAKNVAMAITGMLKWGQYVVDINLVSPTELVATLSMIVGTVAVLLTRIMAQSAEENA